MFLGGRPFSSSPVTFFSYLVSPEAPSPPFSQPMTIRIQLFLLLSVLSICHCLLTLTSTPALDLHPSILLNSDTSIIPFTHIFSRSNSADFLDSMNMITFQSHNNYAFPVFVLAQVIINQSAFLLYAS